MKQNFQFHRTKAELTGFPSVPALPALPCGQAKKEKRIAEFSELLKMDEFLNW